MLIAYTCGGQKSKAQAYMHLTYTCNEQMSEYPPICCSQHPQGYPKYPSTHRDTCTCFVGALTTFVGPKQPKYPKKRPKRPFFHLQRLIAQPPGGQMEKRTCQSLRLDQKIIPAKFRPNPSTFGTTSYQQTDERRGTLQQVKSRFATLLS